MYRQICVAIVLLIGFGGVAEAQESGPAPWGPPSLPFIAQDNASAQPTAPGANPHAVQEDTLPGATEAPRVAVVELFTAQGCSACPPADAFLGELAGRQDVIALALHVDYWDYIGWADDFARPEATKRQKTYARVAGAKMIYTPQAIIGGQEQVIGNDVAAVSEIVRAHLAQETTLRLRFRPDPDGSVMVEAVAVDPRDATANAAIASLDGMSGTPAPGEIVVQLVRYQPEKTVEIGHGENAGRKISYHNIVTDWDVLGRWNGTGTLRFRIRLDGPLPAAVLLQQAGQGPILAGARIK